MGRVFIVGLPRSGTTWPARLVGSVPGVRYVHEPDNRRLEPMAWAATRGLGPVPWLAPGRKADDYRRLWAVAFAGGWPEGHRVIDALRRLGRSDRVPPSARVAFYRQAARLAAHRAPAGEHQVVKSVSAYLSIEWIAREFDPAIVVVWRHPLNLTPAWVDQGWVAASASLGGDAVRLRFEGTPVWPPPEGEGLIPAAWSACARSVLLLESVDLHPEWIVVSHEEQCIDPATGFSELFGRLGFDWTPDMARRLEASNRPGKGYVTNRRWSEEPFRWKERLEPDAQRSIATVVDRFASVSEVAASAWSSSAAVRG